MQASKNGVALYVISLDGTPYRNVRLVDAARLLSGAVKLKPPNPALTTKLIARLVSGLEAAIVGVDGRAEADRFSRTIRRAYSDIILYLGPKLGESLEDGRMLGPWQLGAIINADAPPAEETVERFDATCQRVLDAYESAGVPLRLISGPISLTWGSADAMGGVYHHESDTVRVKQGLFESPAKDDVAAWTVAHEVAHRAWRRLSPERRESWESFIRIRPDELPTRYAASSVTEAWADAVADVVLGGVGHGSSPAVREAVRLLLAPGESFGLEDVQEMARLFRRAGAVIVERFGR